MSKTIQFTNGIGSIPSIGLGTWNGIQEKWGSDDDIEKACLVAIDAGYRLIDCAWFYCNQECVGRALATKIKEGVIKREDIFVTTKLWNTHHNPELIMNELNESLEQLQLSYVDLYLVHWPMDTKDMPLEKKDESSLVPLDATGKIIPSNHSMEDVWKKMEECQKAGLTRNIGLSNFNSKQVTRILNCCTIKPVNNQIEISPYLQNIQLRDFCLERGITVTAYAPFAAPGRSWSLEDVFQEPSLQELAKSKGKTVAQVILRYHLQCGVIAIPKSVTPSRIKENIAVFDFELSEDEMQKMKSLDRNLRVGRESIADQHPEYPFKEPF